MLINLISYIAAILTTISFIPQAVKIIRTKDTSSISLGMYIMFAVGVLLWLIYGLSTAQIAIALANGITEIFVIIILCYKIAGLQYQQ